MNHSKNLRISGPAANGNYAIVEPGGIIVGEAFRRVGEDGWRDAEANARLWAKAPDLRAALELIYELAGRLEDKVQWDRYIRPIMDQQLRPDEADAYFEAIQDIARAALAGAEAGE